MTDHRGLWSGQLYALADELTELQQQLSTRREAEAMHIEIDVVRRELADIQSQLRRIAAGSGDPAAA